MSQQNPESADLIPILIEPGPTPNQIVGRNVRRIRKIRRWSQEQLVERLDQRGFPGWTVQKVSDAEKARHGANAARADRERQFSVNELVALSWALKVTAFDLLVPDSGEVIRAGMTLNMSRADYTARLFGTPFADSQAWDEYREDFEQKWNDVTHENLVRKSRESTERMERQMHRFGGAAAVSDWKEALHTGGLAAAMPIYWDYRDAAHRESEKG